MIEHKATLLVGYLALLAAVCTIPFLFLQRRTVSSSGVPALLVGFGMTALAGALLLTRNLPALLGPVVVAIPIVVPFLRLGGVTFLGGLCALPIVAGATWWDPGLALSIPRAILLIILGAAALTWPLLSFDRRPRPAIALVIVGTFGLLAALPMGQFSTPEGLHTVWLHWGAYVSPAETLLAGGVPFRDFPVQYGLGPTTIIAGLCRSNCFQAMYVVSASANALYLVALCGCVLALTRRAPPWLGWLALAAMVSAALLWTGYPADEMGPLVAPSVAGLRYLPLALLLWFVLQEDQQSVVPGMALWLLGLAWSPEAAFFATAIWWPWLALRQAQAIEKPTHMAVAIVVLRVAVTGFVALVSALALYALVFKVIFHDWPSISGLLVYVRNPPGIISVNLSGPLPIFAVSAVLLMLTMTRSDPQRLRQSTASLIALVAAGSYYLGRSHDNNLLNLFPFLLLVLTGAVAAGLPRFLHAVALTIVAAFIAWPATFGVDQLNMSWRAGAAGDLGPSRLLKLMQLDTPEAVSLTDQYRVDDRSSVASARDAIDWIGCEHGERPVILNSHMVMLPGTPGTVWTGINNLGLFAPLPPDVIRDYIARGAKKFRRPGWLLVDRAHRGPWLHFFAESYMVQQTREFGGYTAYRMAPR